MNSFEGDEARYQRYSDLRNGAATRFTVGKETSQYVFSATVENVGYRDQRYLANYSWPRFGDIRPRPSVRSRSRFSTP